MNGNRAHPYQAQHYELEADRAAGGNAIADPPAIVPPAHLQVGSKAAPPPTRVERGGGIRPEVLQRVLDAIDKRYNQTLRVEELGRLACLSPFHFARMFKLSVGQAPHAYIISRRMERARELLAASNVSIAEVARLVGFRTQAHFSGVFRKHVGVTPGQYRRQHRRAVAQGAAPDGQGDVRV
jgi:AraC family transcriptional regulator